MVAVIMIVIIGMRMRAMIMVVMVMRMLVGMLRSGFMGVRVPDMGMSPAETMGMKVRISQLPEDVKAVIAKEKHQAHPDDQCPGAAFEPGEIDPLNPVQIGQSQDPQDVYREGVGESDNHRQQQGMEYSSMRTDQIGCHNRFSMPRLECMGPESDESK